MAVKEPVAITAAQVELLDYNKDAGGNRILENVFDSVAAGTCWAVLGAILPKAVTAANVTELLNPALVGTAEIVSIHQDQLLILVPATLENVGKEAILHTTCQVFQQIDSTRSFPLTSEIAKDVTPTADKNVCVWTIKVTQELDDAKVAAMEAAAKTALETAMGGGTATPVNLFHGKISSNAQGSSKIVIKSRLRLEDIVV